ncbi:MAG: pyridoxal-phosphate dependent enzyme [Bacteroidota bacterium]|nr:pyridoxal-phosphate dependent enzyme [Bacteroidota bacterium]
MLPDLKDIQDAHDRIRSLIHRTPVMSSQQINELLGAEIYFKCENFQKAGAFKFRGAVNSLLCLTKEEAANGVGTHSSGNHAGALAKAAGLLGISAHIVMPENSREVKKKAVAGYGADIHYCKPTLEAREETMEWLAKESGCTFIHPYDRFEIIAGQGTAAVELLEDYPDLDIIMAPVGGGGLLSGTAIGSKGIKPDIHVWAGEPSGANDAWKSFRTGELVPSVEPQTIADGLLTSLSELTFRAIKQNVDEILLCDESNIIHAMRLIWERIKIIVEPSSAVPLGALMQNQQKWKGRKIGIILSGGNVDLGDLPFNV